MPVAEENDYRDRDSLAGTLTALDLEEVVEQVGGETDRIVADPALDDRSRSVDSVAGEAAR